MFSSRTSYLHPTIGGSGRTVLHGVWPQFGVVLVTLVVLWGSIALHLTENSGIGALLTVMVLGMGALMMRQNDRLLRTRRLLGDVVENIDQGLLMIDENRQLPVMNRRAMELLELTPAMLDAASGFDALVRRTVVNDGSAFDAATGRPVPAHHQARWYDLIDGVYERTRPNGTVLEVRTRVLANGGAVRTFADITARREAEARAHHLAHHDALTGLANRNLLTDRLAQALSQAARNGSGLAVLAIDLDRFKAINDGFGHAVGDQLLIQLGRRLHATIRGGDTLARVGADQFLVLQNDIAGPQEAGDLAERVMTVLAEPFALAGNRVQAAASIGIAVHPQDGGLPAELLANADTALYRAKTAGRGGFGFFEAQMDQELRRRRALERDLRAAIGSAQLYLHFQPICQGGSRRVTGFEALARWRHPQFGNVAPSTFIPIAEQCDLVLTLGAWVLEEACRAAAGWACPLRLAVNLSAAQLRRGELPEEVAAVLARTGLPAHRLELEVTETLLIDDSGRAQATLQALRAMGVMIACDDFGTGYSSFGYLQNLSFDRIKIDQSFVAGLEVKPNSLRIVQAILAMAASLGVDVTAEGVETERQLALLQEMRCGEVQGYLLGRPMAGDKLHQLMPAAVAVAVD